MILQEYVRPVMWPVGLGLPSTFDRSAFARVNVGDKTCSLLSLGGKWLHWGPQGNVCVTHWGRVVFTPLNN